MKLFKTSTLLLSCILISNSIRAQQNPEFKFAQTGSECSIVQSSVDRTGNVYVLGGFRNEFQYNNSIINSPFDNADYPEEPFILKTNSNGNPIYLKPLVGVENVFDVNLQKFATNEKGELAAYFSFYNQKSVNIGGREIPLDSTNTSGMVVKLSKSGFLLWAKQLKTYGSKSEVYPKDIKMDEDGSVYLTGYFTGDTADFGDNKIIPGIINETNMFLVKYNTNSKTDWSASAIPNGGDYGGIESNILELGSDGNIYILGVIDGDRSFTFNYNALKNRGYRNTFIACFDLKGEAIWASQCETDNQSIPEDISVNSHGELVFTCFFNGYNFNIQGTSKTGNGSNYDLALIKFGKGRQLEWVLTKATNHTSVLDNEKEAISAIDDSSKVYLALKLNSNLGGMEFLKLNNPDSISWDLTASSSDDIYFSEAVINEDNLSFSGYTNNRSPFSIGDITTPNDGSSYNIPAYFCGLISPDGKLKYVYNKPNTNFETVNFTTIGADKFGGSYIIGNYSGINPKLEQYNLKSQFTNGLFIGYYNYTTAVSGKVVNFDGNIIPEGQVKLIGYTNRQKSPISDSVQIQADGSYIFPKVPLGKYILVASTDYADEDSYLPSYYVSSGHWEQAKQLEILEPTNKENVKILMLPASKATGDNELSGTVSQVEENDLFKSTMQKPQRKGRANLAKSRTKSDWEIIATTLTDDYGNFGFSNVANGSYTVFVEIPGISHEYKYYIDVTGSSHVSDINYLVGEETITVTNPKIPTKITTVFETKTLAKIYPNPSSGEVYLSVPENEIIKEVLIQDLQGKTLKIFSNISGSITLYDLPSGIYFANIITDKMQETIKFVIMP